MMKRALFLLAATLPFSSALAQSVAPALPLVASGDLSGFYPNPVVAAGAISNAKMANGPLLTVKGNPSGPYPVEQDIFLGANLSISTIGSTSSLNASDPFSTPILPAPTLSAASWGNNGLQLGGSGVTCTDTTSSGTISFEGCFAFPVGTVTTSSATTMTNLYELYLPAPAAGSGVTATNTYSLMTAGAAKIGGGLNVTGGAINLDTADNDPVNICTTGACTQTVSIGNSANTTAIGGPMTLASTLTASNNISFGPDAVTAPQRALQGNNAAAGNTDDAGGQLTLAGGVSTGMGLGGSVVIKTSRAASTSGTTQNSLTTAYTFDAKDHEASGGQKPTIASCGTSPTVDSNATDSAGTANIGTGTVTSCTISFKIAYGTYNHCVVSPQSALGSFGYSYTTSAITLTGSALSGKVDYRCEGT
jgi:hypothetical protein